MQTEYIWYRNTATQILNFYQVWRHSDPLWDNKCSRCKLSQKACYRCYRQLINNKRCNLVGEGVQEQSTEKSQDVSLLDTVYRHLFHNYGLN
jgi:hypothetical protein